MRSLEGAMGVWYGIDLSRLAFVGILLDVLLSLAAE